MQFPHHENELAQSTCAHPEGGFANVWMHNEMLQVEGKKMSKSLGNFFTVRDLLDQGIPGEVIRFVLLSTHYGKPMDWTAEKAEQAKKTLKKWRSLTAAVEDLGAINPDLVGALCDDLNTVAAITVLHDMAKEIGGDASQQSLIDRGALLSSARFLGLLNEDSDESMSVFDQTTYGELTEMKVTQLIGDLFAKHFQARMDEDYALADRIRSALAELGLPIKIKKDGLPELSFMDPAFKPPHENALILGSLYNLNSIFK